MFKEDGSVIHFNNPKVQASLGANTFAITGQSETKRITDMMPGILNQLRPENLDHLKTLASALAGQNTDLESALAAAGGLEGVDAAAAAAALGTVKEDEEDEVPELVQNFEEAAKIDP